MKAQITVLFHTRRAAHIAAQHFAADMQVSRILKDVDHNALIIERDFQYEHELAGFIVSTNSMDECKHVTHKTVTELFVRGEHSPRELIGDSNNKQMDIL